MSRSSSSSPLSSGNTITRLYRRHPILARISPTSSDTTSTGNSNSESETEHANIVETPKRPKTQRKYTKKKGVKAKTTGTLADTEDKIIRRPKAAIVEKPPKKKSEASKNEVTKKLTTKDMINQALIELNTRKGVSLYAIKKFIAEKHNVDTEKSNHIIKRQLKIGIEEGRIKQTKGIGASGSFKLIATKQKQAKNEASEPPAKKSKAEETDKPKIEKKTETKSKTKKDITKSDAKGTKKKEVASVSKTKESEQPAKSSKKSEQPTKKLKNSDKVTKNSKKSDVDKKKTVKIKATNGETKAPAAKKTQTARRKSIVKIKPPKMKPKAST